MKQANTTAAPTSEEELREKIELTLDDWSFLPGRAHLEDCGYWGTDDGQGADFCNCINRREVDVWPKCLDELMQLLHQYVNTREIEGRISERENTELPTTDHSECFDKRTCIGYQNAASDLYNENLIRIDELTKTKETPHETS